MNKEKRVLNILGQVDEKYIEEAVPCKQTHKKSGWIKWGAVAACLCLVVCIVAIPLMQIKQPSNTDFIGAPNILVGNTTFIKSTHMTEVETRPNGFEYGGVIETGTAKGCPYYISSEIPEWVYVMENVKQAGTVNEFNNAYVRYVSKEIRGKDFIRYNDKLYISMYSAQDAENVDKVLFNETQKNYGFIAKVLPTDVFSFVGMTAFEGFDLIPYDNFGSNTHEQEQQIFANANNDNIILVSTTQYDAPNNEETSHERFDIYIKYDMDYAEHESK